MRTTTVMTTAAVAALLGAADTATAQERRVFGMIGLGPAVPVGAFSDGFGTGWDLTAGIGVALKNSPLEVRGQLTYGSFKETGGATAVSTGTSKPRALNADVLYRLGNGDAKVRPYLVGGAGFSSVKYSSSYSIPGEGGAGFSETDTGISFGGGGGVSIRAGSVGLFAEARYTAIPGSGHSHLPVVVGVRLGRR
jgi:Outer membrane protein beta-barrel domain